MGHYLYFFVGYTFIYDAVYDTEAETGGQFDTFRDCAPPPPSQGFRAVGKSRSVWGYGVWGVQVSGKGRAGERTHTLWARGQE